jgi:hypothetical protein
MVAKMNLEEGLILGALLGDGCLSRYSIILTGNVEDDEKFITEIMKPKFEKRFGCKAKVYRQPKYGKLDLRINSKKIFLTVIKKWNLTRQKSGKKYIPLKFLCDKKLMRNIISGFFATDGSLVITNNNGYDYPRIEFQNISKKLLTQTRNFLSKSIGLDGGGLYIMKRKSVVYRLQYNGIENLLKFRKEIGFINPKQQIKFEEFVFEKLGDKLGY